MYVQDGISLHAHRYCICLLDQLSKPFEVSHVSPATCMKISFSGYSPSNNVFFFIKFGLFIPKQYTGMEKWAVVLNRSEWQSQSRKCVNGEWSKRRITQFVSCGCITNIYFTPDFKKGVAVLLECLPTWAQRDHPLCLCGATLHQCKVAQNLGLRPVWILSWSTCVSLRPPPSPLCTLSISKVHLLRSNYTQKRASLFLIRVGRPTHSQVIALGLYKKAKGPDDKNSAWRQAWQWGVKSSSVSSFWSS